MNVLHTLFYFIVSVGLLVAIHEFGHFWVARRCGIKVIRFSIGFGKVLWKYQQHSDATEYVLSAIPLGGYVKMVDEREGEVQTKDLPFAFNRQSLFKRFAVVAAGPIFNLALAILLFWNVLIIGEMGIKPILGKIEHGTLAYDAHFIEGDEIVSVNDKLTPTWMSAIQAIVSQAMEGENEIFVKVKHDEKSTIKTLTILEADNQNPETLYAHLGFTPFTPVLQPIIGHVLENSPAKRAGFQEKDVILNVNQTVIENWQQWVEIIKTNPNQTLQVLIERDDVRLTLLVTPDVIEKEGKSEGKIGASVFVPENLAQSMMVSYALSPLEALPEAVSMTYDYSATTLKMMGKMFIGKASVENLSGPISIAQYAGQSAEMGLVHFLKFLGLISVSLGVLNLLPVPVLDGGHLMFFLIEGIKGSPVSEKIQLFFQKVGVSFLMVLMTLAMVMDIGRLFH